MLMACPAIYRPVCSTNNNTYDNDCLARSCSARIACEGQCPCATPRQQGKLGGSHRRGAGRRGPGSGAGSSAPAALCAAAQLWPGP